MTTRPMRAAGVALHREAVTLPSGEEVVQWIEAGDEGVVVVTLDDEGQEIGRVAARRRPGHEAAELSAWTGSPWRRHGVAGAAFPTIVAWASEHDVPFLVGAVPPGDDEAVAFLRHRGLILSTRTDRHVRRFALAVADERAAA